MSRGKPIALGLIVIGAGVAATLLILLWPSGSGSRDAPVTTAKLRQSGAVQMFRLLLTVQRLSRVGAGPLRAAPGSETCRPSVAGEPVSDYQVFSYYGNPYTADMGILGELEPEELVQALKDHARLYDSLNGPRAVQPALHLVYATAQPDPGPDGLYLQYVDEETLGEYIDLACENGLLIFLDLQIGRSDVESELAKILPYLQQPHVHVALDPEFAMAEGEVPGESIGSLDAADVNAAQALIQDFVEKRGLPDKVLIVHQFVQDMITHPELIEDYPRVKLVIDMDGFGPSDIKRVKYGWYAAPAEYSGFKLFFRHDPDLMSEQEVLGLEPVPDVIIYQ